MDSAIEAVLRQYEQRTADEMKRMQENLVDFHQDLEAGRQDLMNIELCPEHRLHIDMHGVPRVKMAIAMPRVIVPKIIVPQVVIPQVEVPQAGVVVRQMTIPQVVIPELRIEGTGNLHESNDRDPI